MKKSLKSLVTVVTGVAAAAVISTSALATDITGAGATFPYPIYSKWADAYKQKTGVGLNYQAIGSGGGIAQIKAKTVVFGASDMPLKGADLDAAGLVMFPTVVGAEVLVYHLPGIPSGTLVIDGPTLADIYLGKITKWNDPAIKKLNPKAPLPNMSIIVAHRSDGSGTTFIFADYLGKVSEEWKTKVGEGTSVAWPVGIGGKGNAGVAASVQQTVGSIGYVEYAYAMENHLPYMDMINREGKRVKATMASFQASAAHADWDHADHFYMILTDQPGEESWPIENPTFVLFYKHPGDKAASKQALDFFKWAYANGGPAAESLLYIPLPQVVVDKIENSWKQIDGSGM